MKLRSLHRAVAGCRKCRLWERRRHAGPHNAQIMFIVEAPEEKEDETGRPFRGRSGVFLDELFESAGISREQVYIPNSVRCRPYREPGSEA